jgi:MoxR-like ATPase
VELLDRLAEVRRALEAEIGKRVIGQHEVVEGLLTALLADGHALVVGVPGWPRRCSSPRWRRRWT